jgi:uncharacterized membrane protein
MSGRWTIIALVASLALNLFLLGAGAAVIVIGARVAHQRAEVAASRPVPALRRAALALPPEQRRAFVGAVRSVAQAQRPGAQQARALRGAAWDSLATTQVDAAAIKAELNQARTLEVGARAKIEDTMVDFAVTLPQPQRAAVAGAMRPPLAGAPPRAAAKP